jgi:alpha-ribazole phosphatase
VELLLVRHAEVAEDARGRCYGRLEVALSDCGREQCELLAAQLADERVDVVVSSPRVRARETASPIAAAHGLSVTVLDELAEIDFGALEGRTHDEIAATWPELHAEWATSPATVAFPDGETFADLRERVLDAVARLLAAHEGRRVVSVTHAGVVRTVLAEVLDVPLEATFRLAVDPASVTRVEWRAGIPVVLGVNATR